MRKLAATLGLSAMLLASPTSVLAVTKKVTPTPAPSPKVTPTPTPIATPVPIPANTSTQNTLFFIVVAVLLIAIIWYILGMPDEDEEKLAPTPKKSSKK